MKKSYLKEGTESTIVAAQGQALCTRNLRMWFTGKSICRVCGADNETVAHVVSECSKLTQKEYKQVRHDNVAKILHWKLREKWGFNKAEKWYINKPEKGLESESCKVLCDFPIQTDKTPEDNQPDITVIDKKNKKCILIDLTC